VLILDEPANGLDPQGIRWLRDFLAAFAAQDRSVFVSSHLLNEMALMADSLVLIGRGRVLANGPVSDFITASGGAYVVVRTPDPDRLTAVLADRGRVASPAADGSLSVPGEDAAEVGDAALAAGVAVHELRVQRPSLEEAFMSATEGVGEFVAHELVTGVPGVPSPGQPAAGPAADGTAASSDPTATGARR
jgi:ABC-2 type transport system ATP-binding protein